MTHKTMANGGFLLIVGGDRGTCKLEAERLEPLGLEVRLAGSAGEALGILKSDAPRLMLLDQSLPDTKGLELLNRLGECAIAAPPFLVMNGRSDGSAAVEAMKHGALDYLTKDADFLDRLLPAARKALEKASLLAGQEESRKSAAMKLVTGERELTESRNLLYAVLNNTPDAIAAKDVSGHYRLVSPGACELLHRDPDKIIGRDDAAVFPREKAVKLLEADRKILSSGKVITSEEQLRLNGARRVYTFTRGPLISDDGKVTGIFSIGRDVTDRKQLEERLLDAQKTQSLKVLAGGIAHDFNNMLTAVLGNTSLALEGVPPRGQVFKLLTNTLKAARAAQELTHQLQTFARGERAEARQVLELPKIILEAGALACSGSRTKCVHEFDPDTPAVKGNEGQLKQVINNLVLNASQAMPRGGIVTIKTAPVTLHERLTSRLEPGAYARITVSDTGAGIPQKNIHRIFDPYFSTKKKGRGLGLSMVFSIINNHGGHIGVSSKEGEGTVFIIYLRAAGRRAGRTSRPPAAAKGNKGRILVMDDDKLVLDVLTLMLRRLGYATQTAEDGHAAVAAYTKASAGKHPFSAVILDLTIPGGMGGDEAARRIRAADPGARLVLSSGYSNGSFLANCAGHSFDAVLPKPYRSGEVAEIIGKLLKTERVRACAAAQET